MREESPREFDEKERRILCLVIHEFSSPLHLLHHYLSRAKEQAENAECAESINHAFWAAERLREFVLTLRKAALPETSSTAPDKSDPASRG